MNMEGFYLEHTPLAYRIEDARRVIGIGNTRLYQLIGTGALDARKCGNRTLVTAESLRAYVQGLPRAVIGMGLRDRA